MAIRVLPPVDDQSFLGPDAEDHVGFLRTLWLAVLVCALFWVALALGAAQLVG